MALDDPGFKHITFHLHAVPFPQPPARLRGQTAGSCAATLWYALPTHTDQPPHMVRKLLVSQTDCPSVLKARNSAQIKRLGDICQLIFHPSSHPKTWSVGLPSSAVSAPSHPISDETNSMLDL